MSSPIFCAGRAPESPILFSPRPKPELVLERFSALPKLARVTAASCLGVRPTPELVSSGIPELDALTGGLARGCLSEICGPASSGRTSVLLATLAVATRRQEACALVDTSDAFDPLSAAVAGVDFEKMLWVRCASGEKHSPPRHRDTEQKLIRERKREERDFRRTNRFSPKRKDLAPTGPLEQALRATDLLLQSGGFGLIILDLSDVPFKSARHIPLTTWFRFQRAVETTPTIFFVVAEAPLAETCTSLLVKLSAVSSQRSHQNIAGGHGFSRSARDRQESRGSAPEAPSHAQLLEGLHIEGELLRSRQPRKPAQSATTSFITNARISTANGQ